MVGPKILCKFCAVESSKYKCPKCGVNYCSLKCFKDPNHLHEESKQEEVPKEVEVAVSDTGNSDDIVNETNIRSKPHNEVLVKLQVDPTFLNYLREPVIRYHILVIREILNEVSITQEYSKESRVEIASKKLSNLRLGGLEENEIFNEFIEYILSHI